MVALEVISAALLSGLVLAQCPPTPEGLTTIESEVLSGVTITYKKVPVRRIHSMAII